MMFKSEQRIRCAGSVAEDDALGDLCPSTPGSGLTFASPVHLDFTTLEF